MKPLSINIKPRFWRQVSLQSIPKLVLLPIILLLFLAILILYNRPFSPSVLDINSSPTSFSSFPPPRPPSYVSLAKDCDISRGEWVRDPEASYYTNMTCPLIQDHQNCMKYGRPNMDFLKWRWKPEGCELPRFELAWFLELVRNKSLAFLGDSLARNQMQSLMCLLARAEYPKDLSDTKDENFKRMFYATYNFTLSIFWSQNLVKAEVADPDGPNHTGLYSLYLDEADESWASHIKDFDYVVISGGNWFTRPSMFYEKRRLVGCHYCLMSNVTDLTMYYSHRMAFRTAFRALNGLAGYRGVTFLRTSSPGHFEGGEWNKGGDCKRTRPFRSSEMRLEGMELELYRAQVEEFRAAEREGRERGLEFRLLDTTGAMLLRPDGHPSRYGHWPEENVTLYNDCVHWCLPGPVDTWNALLLRMLRV